MTNRTILITGANRGIGLELTEQFAKDGWQVLACCRSPADAGELQALTEQGTAIEVHTLDVTNYEQMASLADQLRDRPIDILLSNAGIYGSKGASFGEIDAVEWRNVLEVNTIAPLMLVQAFVEQVAASQQKLVAVISSKVGSIADNSSGGSYMYRSSKTAVNQVVKSLSIDLADRGISVISLHPGWVQTDMGGPNAEISTDASVSGLKNILQSAGLAQSGQFIEYDGSSIPW
ncbi:MAG: SDR family oxidoreductase [Gammaproteobacteria bacterium]|nr:SDR family oxidoreductase [Gammaproteobacteria bacterium]MDH3856623.1 SDR family oxidoreductase [Gammaproteobacteria bacterium]